ncbi:MAG: alpha-galactosidase, partial [Clostridia bacterium]|nr:alpha-galactosidase [Clostridia bacterium]
GMLAYFPQIWCSDNTDPICRLTIQEGTSFGYPAAVSANHVSASPNHQTGRTTPLGTRFTVAMAGAFGYELSPAALSEEEKAEIRSQIARYREWEPLVRNGDYYRLAVEGDGGMKAWMFVSEDKTEALLSVVATEAAANPRPAHLRLKGLDPKGRYRLAESRFYGCGARMPVSEYSAAALMFAGLTLPPMPGDYPSAQFFFRRMA